MNKYSSMLGIALATGLAASAAAQQRVTLGHLMDLSGATSDVGTPFSQGVNDSFAWLNGKGGVSGRQFNVLAVDYGYQAPRAVSQYQAWARDRVVGIMGWGTADTEALVKFVTRDKIPYVSGSYAATLTDAAGKSGRPGAEATGYNFFYGPSYSDALRAMLKWAADDWKAKGKPGRPKYVHMGGNHPYPNSPKEAGEAMAKELGFDVLPSIVFALTPGDYTAQCLTLKSQGANYAYLGNTAGSNISVLRACQTAGVDAQFLGNVWGMDENAMKAAGAAANGVVFPVRTAVVWGQSAPGMANVEAISRVSDPAGRAYRPVHYLAGICASMLMAEAVDSAISQGGELTGEKVRNGFYARTNWVPKGFEGVCNPSTFNAEDHRGTLRVALYRAVVAGDTSNGTVQELMGNGTMKLQPVATIELERKRELLGW